MCGRGCDGVSLQVGGGVSGIAFAQFGYGRTPAVEHIAARFGRGRTAINGFLALTEIVLIKNGYAVFIIERNVVFNERTELEDGCKLQIIIDAERQRVVLRIEVAVAVLPVVEDKTLLISGCRDGDVLVEVALIDVIAGNRVIVLIQVKRVDSQSALVYIENRADSITVLDIIV